MTDRVLERDPSVDSDEETSSDGTRAPEPDETGGSFLRHPLVVGAVVTAIGALFASLLIPAATRSWQDRPRELALKRELVERISRGSAAAVAKANSLGYLMERSTARGQKIADKQRDAIRAPVHEAWRIHAAVIGAQLATYFGDTSLPDQWGKHETKVVAYISYMAGDSFYLTDLRNDFKKIRFDVLFAEQLKRDLVEAEGRSYRPNLRRQIALLLRYEREQITKRLIASDAAGFSHGLWIFD